ncbi:Plant peroxidase [Macleaya cordata]|uniref:Peroxidase n=1 Tax=Macleaya cordata TaxID=56857 RepID=A0A200QKP7_MACCD|nr:Plant peroxidase [Macleaya cordata]
MRREWYWIAFVLVSVVLAIMSSSVDGAITVPPSGLIRKFYKLNKKCPDVEEYIKHQVKEFWIKDKTITPKLLRLLYSDCFVSGCDASILLDGPRSEKRAPQNARLGGFAFIDLIKEVVEKRCPGAVSCADILVLATRDAVHLAGAPSYPVRTGRKDGVVSNAAAVDLPSPSISLEASLSHFRSKGLDVLDMTTLLGAHTMGSTRCRYILDRLYNFNGTRRPDPNMDPSLVTELRKKCPSKKKKGQPEGLVYLNPENTSKYRFNNTYYSRVLRKSAVLGVDQQLLLGQDTKLISQEFDAGFEDWRKSWALSMNRMANIGVLTGEKGQIRRHCRFVNKD